METTSILTPEQELMQFMRQHYTPEFCTQLQNAIALLNVFEVPGVNDDLCEMLCSPEADNEEVIHTAFSNRVLLMSTDLIESHGITLDEPSLGLMVEIMAALFRIQRTEDPVPFLRLLEVNTMSDEEKLSAIFTNICNASEVELMEAFVDIDENLLTKMTDYLSHLSQQNHANLPVAETETQTKIVKNFKHFITKFGTENLGYEVMELGMLIGMPSAIYLAYFEDSLKESDPDTKAIDLLSLFFLAEDTWLRPIEAYREISERIVSNPGEMPRVEKKMQEHYELFKQYVEVSNDAASVSAT